MDADVNSPDDTAKLLTVNEVAEMLGVSVPTLARWRLEGSGPCFLKLGTRLRAPVRYRRSDVLDFLSKCERRTTASESAAG